MSKERTISGIKVVVSGETYDEYKGTLQEQLEEKDKEIERLKLELSGYRQAILQDKEMLGLKQENERLNNIIKEVREYIQDRYDGEVLTHTFDKCNVGELLEILDKGSE